MLVMGNVIRETLRVVKNGPALHRNLADNLFIYYPGLTFKSPSTYTANAVSRMEIVFFR